MKSIAILGCGQLGSRHLQSLASIKIPSKIYVYDISEKSLEIASERYNAVKSEKSPDCYYATTINELPVSFDLVIIANNSSQRLEVIEKFLSGRTVKYMILEKVLFPQINQYEIAEKIFRIKNIQVWVNCNKSSNNNLFSKLKGAFGQNDNLRFKVEGGNWGLACNAVHFIELFTYLIGENEYKFDISELSPVITDSKRQGYIEFFGVLKIRSGQHLLELGSFENQNSPLFISFSSKKMYAQLIMGDKITGRIYRTENSWNEEVIEEPILKQSQHTSILAEQILSNGTCPLPDFHLSKKMHIDLLRALILHMDKMQYPHNFEECLIT